VSRVFVANRQTNGVSQLHVFSPRSGIPEGVLAPSVLPTFYINTYCAFFSPVLATLPLVIQDSNVRWKVASNHSNGWYCGEKNYYFFLDF